MFNSLYIHVPFCKGGKCDYCAFASQGGSTYEERRAYLDGLKAEFRRSASACAPLRSIFIGGGTPTSLEAEELAELLSSVRNTFEMREDCEWSCEANPESLDDEKLSVLFGCGVNRLSIGVQSFSDEMRQRIGRRGTLEHLAELVSSARKKGLKCLNLDLIYAIPGESPETWRADLEAALALKTEHLSCYSLILEEGTPLARRMDADDDDSFFLECWRMNDEVLGAAGFKRYEISNFAKDGKRCRHNFEVWHGQTYLGCGPAAVSFDGERRFSNPSTLKKWLAGDAPEVDELPHYARMREILAFGMRTTDGWRWDELFEVTGLEREHICGLAGVGELVSEDLIELDDNGLRPTGDGLLFDDRIVATFLA